MKILKFIGIFLGVFLILIFLMKKCGSKVFHRLARESLCESYSQMKFLVINGQVDSVYEDKMNHSVNTVKVRRGSDTQVIYLEPDKSGLFEYIQANDSIFKEYDSYEVVVKRNNEKRSFTLDFGCGQVSN